MHQILQISPKRLFIIDAIGALISSVMLGVVLVKFQAFFGVPAEALYTLAIIPLGFALLDLILYFTPNWYPRGLKLIATLNLTYCFLSLGLAARHIDAITVWGWMYLLGEISLIIVLAIIEFTISRTQNA